MRMDREKVGEMEGSLVELGKENENCGQIIKTQVLCTENSNIIIVLVKEI